MDNTPPSEQQPSPPNEPQHQDLSQLSRDRNDNDEGSAEDLLLFEQTKRQYSLQDIQTIQTEFSAFEKMRKDEKAIYIIDVNQFYEFLSKGTFSGLITEKGPTKTEPEANPKDYEDLIVSFYNRWRENIKKNADKIQQKDPRLMRRLTNLQPPQVTTLDELRDVYRNDPALNEFSAVSYQDGIGEVGMITSAFLHFHGDAYSGYEYGRPETQFRLYLNPTRQALPRIAAEFIKRADEEHIPFYFKLVDFSLPRKKSDDLNRVDRMIFYTDKKNAGKVLKAIEKIKAEHPDWFPDRPIPPMTAQFTEGVGIAEEPSDFQHKNFSRMFENTVSFNWVRAKFLRDVWKDTTRDIILDHPDLKPRQGRSLRQIFNETIDPRDSKYIDQIWKNNFNPESLDDTGKRVLENALLRTMADIIPSILPDSLLPYVQRQVRQKADVYGIDPDNLALNAKLEN